MCTANVRAGEHAPAGPLAQAAAGGRVAPSLRTYSLTYLLTFFVTYFTRIIRLPVRVFTPLKSERPRGGRARQRARTSTMPFVQIAWLPKACRTAAVRKEVADAVLKAMCAVKGADVRHTRSPLAP